MSIKKLILLILLGTLCGYLSWIFIWVLLEGQVALFGRGAFVTVSVGAALALAGWLIEELDNQLNGGG